MRAQGKRCIRLLKISLSIVEQGWIELLRKLADLVRKYELAPINLQKVLETQAASVDEALTLCLELGVKNRIGGGFCDEAQNHIKRLTESTNYIKSKPDYCRLLLPDAKESKTEYDEVKHWLSILKYSGLNAEISEKLGSDDEDVLWKRVESSVHSLKQPWEAFERSLKELQVISSQAERHIATWKTMKLSDLSTVLKELSNDSDGLRIRCRILANQKNLQKLELRKFILQSNEEIQPFYENAGELFERLAVRSLCRKALKSSLCLQEFLQISPGDLQKRFQEIDSQLSNLNIKKTLYKLFNRPVPRGITAGLVKDRTEKGLIDYMVNMAKPRTSLRELMKRSAVALQALKPCFMMSPLSVAQLIEKGKTSFDMVIFDEASQIRPEDAVSSLLRGKQFVIVGDPQQLPPTNFGMKISGGISEEEEDSEDDFDAQESILEVAARSYGCVTMLTRHYRSRDPSLICFSNREFYDGQLEIFPAPFQINPDTGVKFVPVEGIYSHRRNLIEARKTASEVVEYMKNYPDRSIGVVATNMPQAELIEYELDRLVASESSASAYVRKWASTLEPLFVKNLESVQGDERDVIFISTVFGNDEDGNFFQRFGPINSAAGHRRLNVLFTRAKYQVVLLSSIPIQKIQLGRAGGGNVHRGVSVLRKYLEYASSGQLAPEAIITSRGYDSPFEQAVASELKKMGFDCLPQIGVKGFFIDLAIRHPSNPHQFILGIECDGASYHSSRIARDRDRLRQEILEKLGWKLHRIWSTDWFNDQRKEIAKLKEQIDSALLKNRALNSS